MSGLRWQVASGLQCPAIHGTDIGGKGVPGGNRATPAPSHSASRVIRVLWPPVSVSSVGRIQARNFVPSLRCPHLQDYGDRPDGETRKTKVCMARHCKFGQSRFRFTSDIAAASTSDQNRFPAQSVPKNQPTGSEIWSGRRDSNSRPPVPKTGALPDCATPRQAPLNLQPSA